MGRCGIYICIYTAISNLMIFAVKPATAGGNLSSPRRRQQFTGQLLLHLTLVPGDPAAAVRGYLIGKEGGDSKQLIAIPKAGPVFVRSGHLLPFVLVAQVKGTVTEPAPTTEPPLRGPGCEEPGQWPLDRPVRRIAGVWVKCGSHCGVPTRWEWGRVQSVHFTGGLPSFGGFGEHRLFHKQAMIPADSCPELASAISPSAPRADGGARVSERRQWGLPGGSPSGAPAGWT